MRPGLFVRREERRGVVGPNRKRDAQGDMAGGNGSCHGCRRGWRTFCRHGVYRIRPSPYLSTRTACLPFQHYLRPRTARPTRTLPTLQRMRTLLGTFYMRWAPDAYATAIYTYGTLLYTNEFSIATPSDACALAPHAYLLCTAFLPLLWCHTTQAAACLFATLPGTLAAFAGGLGTKSHTHSGPGRRRGRPTYGRHIASTFSRRSICAANDGGLALTITGRTAPSAITSSPSSLPWRTFLMRETPVFHVSCLVATVAVQGHRWPATLTRTCFSFLFASIFLLHLTRTCCLYLLLPGSRHVPAR